MVIPFTVNNQGMRYAVQAVTDYADPGSTIDVSVDDSNSADNLVMNVDIKGYYVSLP